MGQLHKDNPGLLVYNFDEGVAAVRSKKFAYFEVSLYRNIDYVVLLLLFDST